jgi:ribonuclease-3
LIAAFRRLARRLRRDELSPLERELGHVFAHPALLHHALSHRSHTNNGGQAADSNERLEFLGDAVVDLIVTDELFRSHPDRQEGYLSKVKSLVVSARVLAECARAIDLGRYMKLSRSEEKAGGRDRESILADAFEAVIGAMYLDGGIAPCKRLLERELVTRFSEFLSDSNMLNYKSALLEHAQGRGWGAPRYEVVHQDGPEHGKRYTIAVRVRDEVWGEGDGPSKKEAEQAAARDAIESRRIPIDESAI